MEFCIFIFIFFRPQRKLSKGFGIGEEWIDEPSDVPCGSADSDSARPAGEVVAEPEMLFVECSIPLSQYPLSIQIKGLVVEVPGQIWPLDPFLGGEGFHMDQEHI